MLENTANLGGEFSCPEGRCAAVARVLAKNYISVAELDLCTGNAFIFKSSEAPEFNGREISWDELLERYARVRVHPEDQAAVLSLTHEYLNGFLEQGRDALTVEARCIS